MKKGRQKKLQIEDVDEQARFDSTPVWLFLIGFVLMFAGVVVLFVASALQGNVDISGGGVIFIGPIPIIFGAGPNATLVILLAAILTIIGFIMFFWLRKTRV
jgi:uncharacterized membrane protein